MPTSDTVAVKAGKRASFGRISYSQEGVYIYSITEAKGNTPGMTYDVLPRFAMVTVEEGEDSLVASVTYGKTQETADEDENLTITNTYGQTADLSVKKVVNSSRSTDKTKDFKFKVTLYNDIAHKNVKKLTGTYGDIKFANGVAVFSLKDGQTKTAKGLPVGTYFTADETDSGGLVKSLSVKRTETGSVVTCTNTYKPTTPTTTTNRTTPGTSSSSSYNRTSTPKTADETPQALVLALGIAGALGIAASQLRRRRETE